VACLNVAFKLSHIVVFLVAFSAVKRIFRFMHFQVFFKSLQSTEEKIAKVVGACIKLLCFMIAQVDFQLGSVGEYFVTLRPITSQVRFCVIKPMLFEFIKSISFHDKIHIARDLYVSPACDF